MTIIIGVILIILGTILMLIGYPQFKEELKIVKEVSRFRRVIVYVVTFLGFLDLASPIGWVLSLGLLFNFSGLAFIFLTIIS